MYVVSSLSQLKDRIVPKLLVEKEESEGMSEEV